MSESVSVSVSVSVSEKAKQTESAPNQWVWVDRTVWTERMLAALGNGIKGNKWFSLIDKVYRPSTLQLPSNTQGRSPVRELRTLGSVRGALSNGCLYRDG